MNWLTEPDARARFTRIIAAAVATVILIHFAPTADGLGGVVIVFAAVVAFCAVGTFLWQFVRTK